jgi:N-carbamoyl-L-amino-acid hydrolase
VGSHLDSVPDGGAYDGPLGVVSAFAAVDLLRAQGFAPARPVAVAAFVDEEGARFGVACVGSRLLTGALDADRARALTDADGVSMADALSAAGVDPGGLGRDDDRLAQVSSYVELHVEQGRMLADLGQPVAVAGAIWPHARYRFTFDGRADHAGTTRLEDRRDPMLTYAETVLAARKRARLAGARATFGRVLVEPNATNAVPSRVVGWLDLRALDEARLGELAADVAQHANERAARDGTALRVDVESLSPAVRFDQALRDRLATTLGGVPVLDTQAGHDAGVLATEMPTGMLFVRNPSGVSHSPAEHAERADCLAGVEALARVVAAEAGA